MDTTWNGKSFCLSVFESLSLSAIDYNQINTIKNYLQIDWNNNEWEHILTLLTVDEPSLTSHFPTFVVSVNEIFQVVRL